MNKKIKSLVAFTLTSIMATCSLSSTFINSNKVYAQQTHQQEKAKDIDSYRYN